MASTAALVRRVIGCVAVLTLGLAGISAVTVSAVGASVPTKVDVHFEQLAGFTSPGTPAKYNKVGILKTGPSSAKNILVLVPGTSASAAYFEPLAKDIVAKSPGWQVWAVERRENLLEDQSVLDQAKAGKASAQKLFDYYLGFTTDPSVKDHFKFLKDDDVAFGRDWGMKVEIEDLRRVVQEAAKDGDKVVLGGHSLGGSIVTAYATWDFGGHAGAEDLDGLVYIDGGSSPTPDTPEVATTELQQLKSGSPWLTFGGIPAPYAGLFNSVASTLVHNEPDAPALLSTWPALPAFLKAPVAATNVGGYGYALDTKTSPAALRAAQAHLGQLAATGDPRGWDSTGALTPIQRYADMFSGTGLKGLDGTAWYHPQRLTIDAGRGRRGQRQPNASRAQRQGHARSRPAEAVAHLRVRRCARGTACAGRGQDPRRAVQDPSHAADARESSVGLRAQRSGGRQPEQRLPQEPGALLEEGLELANDSGLGDPRSPRRRMDRRPTQGDQVDNVKLLQRAVDEAGGLVDHISPDQLGNDTPCSEWCVRDLINHVTGGSTMFAISAEQGSIPDDEMARLATGDNLGDDYKGAFHAATDRAMAAFGQPGVLEKVVKLPFGEMPAGVALNIAVFDVTTHATDLARATGQTIKDPDLLKDALTMGQQMIGPEMRQPGLFDPEQTAPDGASAEEQLQAFAGRRV